MLEGAYTSSCVRDRRIDGSAVRKFRLGGAGQCVGCLGNVVQFWQSVSDIAFFYLCGCRFGLQNEIRLVLFGVPSHEGRPLNRGHYRAERLGA